MGAWGHLPFENDDALDWLAELPEAVDAALLADAFDEVPREADEYLEAPEASAAVAAGEVVAALLGRPSPSLPAEAGAWAADRRGAWPKLQKKALRAVHRVLKDSELRELWEESPDFPKWRAAVEDLLRRLA